MNLHFYKRTTYPTDAHYYNITKGIAGYLEEQPRGVRLFKGTIEEYEDLLDSSIPKRGITRKRMY